MHCARLSLPWRIRSRVKKLTSCMRKFNGELLRKYRGFRYICRSNFPFFASHMRQWYEVRKIRYLVEETYSGQDVAPRSETSALLSCCPLASSLCILFSTPFFPVPFSILHLPNLRELSKTLISRVWTKQEEKKFWRSSQRCNLVYSQRLRHSKYSYVF